MRWWFPFLLYLLCTGRSFGQEILWASEVVEQYNGFSESGDWSAEKSIGFPDALPQGELSPNAFRLNSEASFGSIILAFPKVIPVNFIVLSENHEPGRITEVFLYDESGKRIPVFKSEAANYYEDFRILVLNTSGTKVLANKIEINLNTAGDPAWSQIDAVGISDHTNSDKILEELSRDIFFNIREEMAFLEFKEKLGKNINTKYDETKPLISPDGRYLYFSRAFHPNNIGGKKDAQDILISESTGNQWTIPINPGGPLNNKHPNGVSSVSPDGNSLYLINNYYNKSDKTGGIALTKNSLIGWIYPSKVEIKNYRNRSEYEDFFISSDGQIMILALEDATSYGQLDLYISFFDNSRSEWSEPINLGPTVNTRNNEFAPFLATDNKTLYFSSDGHPGYGKSDIFFSYRMDESWLNWITPQNLGNNVNTDEMDGYYTVSARGDYGYFISRSGGISGSRDIYKIKLTGTAKPDPVILVKGKVFDTGNNEPIGAGIEFKSSFENGNASSGPQTGEYTLVLKGGSIYNINPKKEGYISQASSLDLTNISDYTERSLDLYLMPIRVGSVIKLSSVHFKQSKPQLMDGSYLELDSWVKIMTENPEMEIELGGHTDNRGNENANMALSSERVAVVKDYLVSEGVESNRIKTKGYGSAKPLNNNATEEKRAENRRVEITIISN